MSAMVEGAFSGLITNLTTDLLSSFKKKWSIKGKKKRLEELLIQIQSVLDVTKSRVIRNKSLKRWLKKLKKAADHGDRALKTAKRLVVRENKPFSIVSPIRYAAAFFKKFLFTGSGAIKKLDFALEELETVCRNLKLFLRLIELDKSSKKDGFSVRHFRMKARKKFPLVVVSSSIQDRSDEDLIDTERRLKRSYYESFDKYSKYSVLFRPFPDFGSPSDFYLSNYYPSLPKADDTALSEALKDLYYDPLLASWPKNIRKKKKSLEGSTIGDSAFNGGYCWGNAFAGNHPVEDEGNSEIVKSCVGPSYTCFDNSK